VNLYDQIAVNITNKSTQFAIEFQSYSGLLNYRAIG